MSLIKEEFDAAKAYEFVTIPNTQLVELSRRNVALAEATIRNDSAYLKSSDEKARPDGHGYEGSTAYWMMQLKDILIDEMAVSHHSSGFEEVLKNVVISVDRDNSTHLNADEVGRDEMFDRLKVMKNLLKDYLKDPKPNYELIRVLVEWTHPRDDRHKARRNLSFASKFCQEACFYLFAETDAQDNFSKYDGVVRKAIPLYLHYYHIDDIYTKEFGAKDLKAYKAYQAAIDAILGKLNEKISRNGFDHLVWYYFKGRPSLLKGGKARNGAKN